MNERMIELYKEASEFAYKICREEGREGGTSDHIWNTLSTGKFAELIVKECLSVSEDVANADGSNGHWFDGYICGVEEVTRRVKQHFGVEE